jgi:hypothetical protein
MGRVCSITGVDKMHNNFSLKALREETVSKELGTHWRIILK